MDLNDVRDYDSSLCLKLQREPSRIVPSFEVALFEEVQRMDKKYSETNTLCKYSVGFTGNATNHITPRSLQSIHIGKLVCVDGIVTSSRYFK